MDLEHIRKDYLAGAINGEIFPEEPFDWFVSWLKDAVDSGEPEPTALVLSTVSSEGNPSSRVVLLKSFDKNGFVFFTNYQSRKGIQLSFNNAAAMVFFWPLTERQVRIEGFVNKVDLAESDQYFASRPPESRINAIISPQSNPIASRKQLEEQHLKLLSDSIEKANIRPENWGGYRLIPHLIEFWQGRPGRLHDRIQFELSGGKWLVTRLAP